MAQYAIGQSGIQFGGGAFQWVQHPDGTYGWSDPTSGRTWDSYGNPYQATAPQGATPATGYVAPGVPSTTPNALQQQQNQAQSILDQLPTPNKINAFQYGKLNTSGKQFVLGAYEAKGFDPGDVEETIKNILPKAVGPRRGYVAPLGAR